jgi:glyoxylase-like metal-dependent hydrolase (beta-lactamase superfamily II)
MTAHPSFTFGELALTQIVTSPPWYENCYLVRHVPTGAAVAVDPGGDGAAIVAELKAQKAALAEIWLTHGHPDHIAAVAAVQDAFPVPCRAHADEKPIIDHAPRFAAALMGFALEGPRDCRYFDGAAELVLGGRPVRALHTPGHTPGCVCYDFGPFVLTGDTLFNQGVGRTDLPGGDGRKLGSSITGLLAALPAEAVLFSGHGPEWTVAEARHWWEWMS